MYWLFVLLRLRFCFLGRLDMRLILFSLLLFLSFNSWAVDYYWRHGYSSSNFPSAIAGCQDFLSNRQATMTDGSTLAISGSSYFSDETHYWCYLSRTYPNGTFQSGFAATQVTRFGTTCPPDTTYNSLTGGCDAPEPDGCSALAGTSTPFSKSGTAPDDYATVQGGYGTSAQSGCFDSCAASTVDQKCVFKTSGVYTCRGTAYFTGEACQASSSTVGSSDTSEGPEPQTSITDKPCVFETQPDGTQACQSEKATDTEGQFCGEVNGVKRCVDAKPTKNGVTVDTTVDTETNTDGSSTTTKTDTATKTNCSGINSCSSSTTTTTTTTVKDSSGNTTNSNSNCTGSDCASDAKSDQNANGLDDCTAEGDCSAGGAVSGEDCGVPLDCEGDAIACAVLKQEKDLRCKVDELYDLDSNQAAIDQLLQGEQFEITEQEVQAPSFISEATSFLPKSCPSPESASLNTGGLNVSLEFQPLCDFAEALGPLIVIVATVFASLYVGRAFGGE